MPSFDFTVSIIALLSGFLALFFAFLFFNIKHGNRKANRYLALFFISVSGALTQNFLILSGHYREFPSITLQIDSIRYLMAPLFYFYVRTLADPEFRFQKWDPLHLIPFVFNIFVISKYFFIGNELQAELIRQWVYGRPRFNLDVAPRMLLFIHFCLCLYLAVQYYLKAKTRIEQSSSFGPIYVSWIRYMSLGILPTCVIWIITIPFVASGRPFHDFLVAISLMGCCMIFLTIFPLFSHPEILYLAKPLSSLKKYHSSPLSDRDMELYHHNLLEFMEKKEAYLDPDLNLAGLAEKIDVPKNHLSRIINEKER
ncbi:MAG: hypothetical protein EHM45_21815, partial [Desulfobacteraceae bacterium]